jgi:hypothetical protein
VAETKNFPNQLADPTLMNLGNFESTTLVFKEPVKREAEGDWGAPPDYQIRYGGMHNRRVRP